MSGRIEVSSAGCPVCEDAIQMVQEAACPSCEIGVLDTNDPAVAGQARTLGVRAVPELAVDGELKTTGHLLSVHQIKRFLM